MDFPSGVIVIEPSPQIEFNRYTGIIPSRLCRWPIMLEANCNNSLTYFLGVNKIARVLFRNGLKSFAIINKKEQKIDNSSCIFFF